MMSYNRILFLADINSIHTERWVRLLTDQNLEVGVFSLHQNNTNWAEDLGIRFETFQIKEDVAKSRNELNKLSYFKAPKAAAKFIKSFQPDIVHAHYATSYGMLAKMLKFPTTVLSLWGSDVFEFPKKSLIHRWYFKRIVRSADLVCSTSKAMAQEAKKYVDRKYVITPFGTDVNFFTPRQRLETGGKIIFGTVKTLEKVYGIDRLIAVFNEYQKSSNQKSELHIYGKGSEENNLKMQVSNLGLEDKVFFHGFVKGDALLKAFQSLDVAMFLSRSESFGVAALEAQSCGVPSIVSNVGGLPEVCANEDFIIDGDNTEVIIQQMRNLENAEVRSEKGEKARAFVVSQFSNESCVHHFLKAYDEV